MTEREAQRRIAAMTDDSLDLEEETGKVIALYRDMDFAMARLRCGAALRRAESLLERNRACQAALGGGRGDSTPSAAALAAAQQELLLFNQKKALEGLLAAMEDDSLRLDGAEALRQAAAAEEIRRALGQALK